VLLELRKQKLGLVLALVLRMLELLRKALRTADRPNTDTYHSSYTWLTASEV
jgi:hypothetical protein